MKKIGLIDFYMDEWHAHHVFNTVKACNEKNGTDYAIAAVWAETDLAGGMTTDEYCAKYGVEKCNSIAQLAEKVDYLIVLSPDNAEKKLGYAKEAFKAGKNVFIDKTFTDSYASALAIFQAAEETGAKFFSSSALRYATELAPYNGNAKSVFVFGSGVTLADYAVHYLEIVMKTMGVGVEKVRHEQRGNQEWAELCYADGRKATLAISMAASYLDFGVLVADDQNDSAFLPIASDFFGGQMEDVLRFFESGISSFDSAQTLELMKVRDGIMKSKEEKGVWITL
ncbi:MAG: Gfo/Idh/MocA family oxidoreductase [Clostridia bacterium]|nr:Gfo/Idh/MocA family oxidoreductase [Clostridia bacterium]